MSTLDIRGGDKKMVLSILDKTGDTKIMWNPRDKDEVGVAEDSFKKLTKKGFRAFKVAENGAPGERIEAFDKHAEKIIMVPQMAGGGQ